MSDKNSDIRHIRVRSALNVRKLPSSPLPAPPFALDERPTQRGRFWFESSNLAAPRQRGQALVLCVSTTFTLR